MPTFKDGIHINKCNDPTRRYLRISAGPQRGKYVHDLVLEAKIGRKLRPDETAEHKDGNGLNCDPDNIIGPIHRDENTARMQKRKYGNDKAKVKRVSSVR